MTFSNNDFQGKHSRFFIGLYRRNRAFIIAAAAIFFLFMFIGYFLSGTIDHFMANTLTNYNKSYTATTVSIFLNNFKVALIMYAGGVLFGIPSVANLSLNGLFLGYFFSKIPIPVGIYALCILPHSIFELPAYFIAVAGGFRLISTIINIIKSVIKKTPTNEHYWGFRESIALFMTTIVLLFIAAVIEANISPLWANYILSVLHMNIRLI